MDIRFINVVVYLFAYLTNTLGFNIDIDSVLTLHGPEGSNFGYSAVMYIHEDKKWVVVGAPKANFTDGKTPELDTPGNVFKCPINLTLSSQDACEPINPRQSRDSRWPWDKVNLEENKELLGASMTLIDNDIITCAPQWKNSIPYDSSKFVHAIGRCFNIDKTLDNSYTDAQFKNRHLPERDDSQFALIGFSLPDKKYFGDSDFNVVIGAPGFHKDKGGFIQYSSHRTTDHFKGYILEPIESKLNGSIEIESLFGYSIATGTIRNTGDNCIEAVVTGTPHFMMNQGIVGTVVITCVKKETIVFKQQLLGHQPAGGFGSAVVFDDINGDGLNDLLVGAPEQFDDVIDTGAVHVYTGMSSGTTLLNTTGQVLKGSVVYGRFGTAVKCIGDINKDGFNDVAVGAPYENDGRGSVYIYHGGSELIFTQRIQASDIDSGLKSFGWFIGVSFDIDKNNFTDMIVGSYGSDVVTVLRTRPIVSLSSSMEIYPKEIPLNSSGQDCQDNTFRPCVTVYICFSYNGTDVPDNVLIGYQISVDTERTKATPQKTNRLHLFYNGTDLGSNRVHGHTILIPYGVEVCLNFSAIVEPVNREFYASLNEKLVVEMEYGLADQNISGTVEPILDQDNPTLAVDSANFSSGCDGACKPNLNVIISSGEQELTLGVTSEIVITVVLTNHGEQSHSTWITMPVPNNTLFINYNQPTDQVTDIVDCDHKVVSGFIQCDLRSLFYNKQVVIVNFRFYASRDTLVSDNETLGNFDPLVSFRTNAFTTGIEADNSDNSKTIEIKTRLYSKIEFTGASKPEQLRVSDDLDKHLYYVHTYSVLNGGPSPLFNSTIEICIPITNDTGIPLMDVNDLQVISNNPSLSWRVLQFPGLIGDDMGNSSQQDNSTQDQQLNLPLVGNEEDEISKITCDTTDANQIAVIHVNIKQLERDEKETFSLTLNISEEALQFTKSDGIIYKTKASLQTRNNSRYFTSAVNISYEISSDIFPKIVEPEPTEINLWIIIGGSGGGLVLLVILGIILWKCKFFERKKRDDTRKRRTMYLAEVEKRRTMAISTLVTDQRPINGSQNGS